MCQTEMYRSAIKAIDELVCIGRSAMHRGIGKEKNNRVSILVGFTDTDISNIGCLEPNIGRFVSLYVHGQPIMKY